MPAKPFALMTFAEVREILHRKARGEQELLEGVEEIDAASIYYHTHSHYMHERYLQENYPNDFASWVANDVRDRVLSERLAVVDPFAAGDLESVRRELIQILEDHLDEMGFSPRALFGEPFHFLRSHLIPIVTGTEVRSREELKSALAAASPGTLYYHFFEDALGKGRKVGAIVDWVATELKDTGLADAIGTLNPYRINLTVFRKDLQRVLSKPGETA